MVRVAVATQNGGLEDNVSQVFGRCQSYTFVDLEDGDIQGSEVNQNQFSNATSGAGIQVAGFVANQGADAVIAGNFGPNVVSVFEKSGVDMFTASGMTVREAVEAYGKGELQSVKQATAQAMSGSGGGRGMGRGMSRQQTGQGFKGIQTQSTERQPNQKEDQSSFEGRVENIDDRIRSLEGQLDEIQEALEDLKDEK